MRFLTHVMVTVGATIVGISLVQLANGYLGTLVSMRTASAGFPAIVAGIVLAAYYGGYTLGAMVVGAVLQRVGHIRMFAALAGLVAGAIALQPVLTSPAAWIIIRLVTGLGCAGLFVTCESWLNAAANPQNRGTIFAIYMVSTYATFGAGQFLLNLPAPGGFELFALAAALFCFALVPVSLTRSAAPALAPGPRLRMRELRATAPVALAGCGVSGMFTSAFYALVPAYAQGRGYSAGEISTYVAVTIFGGLAFQIPVGKISDMTDRRVVAAGCAAGFAVTCVILAAVPLPDLWVLGLTFVLGGFMSTIYPVCVAHANDRVAADKVVAVSGQLILVNGIASFLSPLIGSALLGHGGIAFVFLYMAVLALAFIAVALWRVRRVEAAEQKDRPFVILGDQVGHTIAHVADSAEAPDPDPDAPVVPARIVPDPLPEPAGPPAPPEDPR